MVRRSNRRLTIVSIVVFVVVIAFAFRLVDFQVVRARALDAESSQSLTVHQTITGDRGDITTSDGTPLAATVLRYDVTAAPVDASTFTRTVGKKTTKVTVATAMNEVAAATGATAQTLTSDITANKKADFASLVKSITVAQYQAVTALHIPYVYLVKDSTRSYPDGAVAGNLVGFVGDSGAQAGLELQQNKCLAGTNGSETYETGADGVELPGTATVTKKPVAGGTVTTTISGTLQYLVQNDLATQAKALGAQSATAIVVKVSNGDLESVADWPSVDPNNVDGSSSSDLYSKAFTDLYEPGSTMKGLVASALLNTGKATPTTQATVPDQRTFPWGA
ncbi:hypothetical protein AX769_16745 [Frondihabitans sp. PAMC 28766]|uniref:penicillin-binding transpeptidase domain-containing protein n=1 Tax=Frondihabitans sp. PAMC 28766 TaxID=1795630 RepID=UPI00078D3B25|nr:penicillin-binding transpeptidase domain-containing protein [Frondihabitans sp. PAMC 28766]AMM21482.1 hypothetical protein AX769_16745 [Frondihabitans sp. PAMC 28766]